MSLIVAFTTSAFFIICLLAQMVRKDLNALHVPLTLYLNGHLGRLVRSAYYLMAAGLLALAWAIASLGLASQWSWVTSGLFVISAASLPVLVITRPRPGHVFSKQALYFHRGSTYFTFVNLIAGMSIVSCEHAAAGGTYAVWGFALSVLAMIGLFLSIFARSLPHGLVQKALILTIILWLYWADFHVLGAAGV
ncbi:DUF998 domain-containing protein [Stenotrophomonas maltophilia]|nr:DUF998 domain-containing protein [Stenotrophomonas maltophilia]